MGNVENTKKIKGFAMKNNLSSLLLLMVGLLVFLPSVYATEPLVFFELNNDYTDTMGGADAYNLGSTFITDYPTYATTGDGAPTSAQTSIAGQDSFLINRTTDLDLTTKNWSISMWANITTKGVVGRLFAYREGASNIGYYIYWTSVEWAAGTVVAGSVIDDNVFTIATEKQWNHIVATRNIDTGTVTVYVNGVNTSTGGTSGAPSVGDYDGGNVVGLQGQATNRYLDAGIDDVAIWDIELSKTEVIDIYNNGITISGAPPITNTSWNVTSGNVVDTNTTRWENGFPINLTSDLLSFTFTASASSNASCSLNNNLNYTSMIDIDTDYKLATTGTDHSYTLKDSLSLGTNTLYCSMIASDGTLESLNSHSGPLIINYLDITPPNPFFIDKYPADLRGGIFKNSWYRFNITDDIELNTTWLLTSVNSSDNIIECIGGICKTGTQTNLYDSLSISGNLYNFSLDDNQQYPGTYPLNPEYVENTPHLLTTLSNTASYVRMLVYNMSNIKNTNVFEIMANSSGLTSAEVHYCNSSYSTGNPEISPNCANIGVIRPNPWNHTHSIYSGHAILPFSIVNKQINNIGVSPSGYFLLRGVSGGFSYYYINNNTNSIHTTTNNGATYTAQTYTIDSHLHQFNTSNFFQINVCANDSSGNVNCSVSNIDTFDFDVLPPSPPEVYSPSGLVSGVININWTASVPGISSNIVYYDLNILNSVFSLETALGNQTLNLSKKYDTSGLSEGSYYARVTAYINNSLSNFGTSEAFIIDSTDPTIMDVAQNSTSNESTTLLYATLSDTYLNGYRYGDNSSGTWNVSGYFNITGNTNYIMNFTIDTIDFSLGQAVGYYIEVIDYSGRNAEINSSFNIDVPIVTSPILTLNLATCPDTTQGFIKFAFGIVFFMFLIYMGINYHAGMMGTAGALGLFFLSFGLTACYSVAGIIVIVLSLMLMLKFFMDLKAGDF